MIQISNDGSHTIVSEKFNVTYHSMHGAVTESKVVFIDSGLKHLQEIGKTKITVFEMGFGTGLNAFMTALWAEKHQVDVAYTGVEAFPISKDQYHQLNYADLLGNSDLFLNIHTAQWHHKTSIAPFFNLLKLETTLQEFEPETLFDIIFYDAFGPGAQPELWDADIMDKMYQMLSPGGLLVTYCAQGQFRRNLKHAGFIVEKIPGPPGKREMTRALKMSGTV